MPATDWLAAYATAGTANSGRSRQVGQHGGEAAADELFPRPLQSAGGEDARHHAQPERPTRDQCGEQGGRRRVGRPEAGEVGATDADHRRLRAEHPV